LLAPLLVERVISTFLTVPAEFVIRLKGIIPGVDFIQVDEVVHEDISPKAVGEVQTVKL
jgi:hypothetical protein